MLIEAIFGALLWGLKLLLLPMDIEDLPESFYTVLGVLVTKLIRAFTIIAAYVHGTYLAALLAFVLAFDGIILLYHLVLFILKKIPFIGIK